MTKPLLRYAAFLRGVMPTNARMPELKRAFEAAGFANVKTVLGSGNLVFDSKAASPAVLEAKAQAAMRKVLGREFFTIVRSVDDLRALLASDPYRGARVAPAAKRIITFLRKPPAQAPDLPIERDNARILRLEGTHLFSAYLPTDKGPVFMAMIEKAVGKEQTTRTWQTVEKMAR
jgi:uncharacterized protein (DUF1697 family)